MEGAAFYVAVLFIIIVFFSLFTYFVPIGLWISAYFAGVKVAIFRDLVGMRLRKVPPSAIVRPKISATKAGLEVELDKMEAHYLAGLDPQRHVVDSAEATERDRHVYDCQSRSGWSAPVGIGVSTDHPGGRPGTGGRRFEAALGPSEQVVPDPVRQLDQPTGEVEEQD